MNGGAGAVLRITASRWDRTLGGRQCRQQLRVRALGGQQRVPRLLDRLYRRVLSAAEGGITGGPSTWIALQSWDGGAQVGEAPLTCAPPSPSFHISCQFVGFQKDRLPGRQRGGGGRRQLRSNRLARGLEIVLPGINCRINVPVVLGVFRRAATVSLS